MAIQVKVEYWQSEIISDMYFFTKVDAEWFDEVIQECIKDSEFIADFKQAMNQFASEYAVEYNIRNETFQHLLKSEKAMDLLCAIEAADEPYDGSYYSGPLFYCYKHINKI